MLAVSIDGMLVAPENATISIFDRGFLFGDGVFEVFRTWDEVAIDLDAHLTRLYASAAHLRLRTIDQDRAADAVQRTLASSGPGEKRIRVVLTRGPGALVARPATLGPGRAIVIVEPLPAQPKELSLAVVDWPLPRRTGVAHKTLAYLDHVLARELAANAGADEALRLGADGDVVECATANVFIVSGGAVATPPTEIGILPGVTRARVLAACAATGIKAAERRLTLAEVQGADEMFVTSAVRGVVPVTRLDGNPRAAGPVTRRIIDGYLAGLRQQTVAPSGDPI
ncbi:MAG TPA: aminotransferase class IV [Kofleriaceae bacterium]|nr:aminotransferase class IV [Kofleriaceae bacterium]